MAEEIATGPGFGEDEKALLRKLRAARRKQRARASRSRR